MAFGNDYDLYDASDDDWTLLVLEDSYFEDLTKDYINLLLNEGFFIDDVTWDNTYYCYDNGYVYIEIYIAYEYGGNYLEIYYEPTHLGTLDSLSLNINQLDVVAGASYQLEPIYNPETAKYPITWSSSDNSVATVDNSGLVTIKNDASVNNSVVITASTAVGKTASCTFNIKENKVTGLLFDKENYDVTPGGKKVAVSYTLLPYGATSNEQVNFSINPTDAGVLFDAGAMSLKAEETAVIGTVVTLKAAINEYEATATVTVISSEISHTLDRDFFGIQKADYSTYKSYKKTTDDGATYEAYAAGNNGIQLRSKSSDSGVIGYCEDRTCKSITFTFDPNTEAGSSERKIDIYASNSPFAITDMFGSSLTKVGSVTFDKNNLTQTYTFTSDYSYIGFRSNNGAVYLPSIQIIWG